MLVTIETSKSRAGGQRPEENLFFFRDFVVVESRCYVARLVLAR